MNQTQDRLGTQRDEAQLRYLRAAEYAQEKRYAEAEAEFIATLEIDPALYTCRFQLGLLQLTNAEVDKARDTWARLYAADVPADLQYFSRGLEAMIVDDFNTAIELLRQGMALNHSNPALNRDMQMVIDKMEATIAANSANTGVENPPEPPRDQQPRTDFSLYDKNKN